MHLVTCSCLNVKIFTKVDLKNSKLAIEDPLPQHSFFFDHSAREVVLHIQGIQIEHNFLIEKLSLQRWIIHRCINCSTLTHAKHLDDDRTLVSSDLLSDKSEIDRLKSSPNYSSLYKIIIEKPSTVNANLRDSESVRNVMQSIQSDFEKYIKKEEEELNNRIRKFEAAERERFDEMKLKLMQEKNMLLSIIVNKDLMKLLDESNAKELPDSAETQEKDALNESAGFLKNCSSSSQQSMEEICSNIPDIIHDASSPDDDDDDDFHLASSFLPIKQPNTSKLFGAINREYSPILSPLTFGVSSVIPEEDEENANEFRDGEENANEFRDGEETDDEFRVGEETDDESESDIDVRLSETTEHLKNTPIGENAVLKRTELKLPLKPTKVDKAISGPKRVGPVGKLLEQDADRGSVGSLDPEDVFFLNVDSDDQRGDLSMNFTSDEDEILQNRAEAMEEELKPTSALYSTSVPIRVPLSLRQNSREVEMIEDMPADAESMAASILALARSCHGDTEIFGELPRPRVKTPRLQHASLGKSSEEPSVTT